MLLDSVLCGTMQPHTQLVCLVLSSAVSGESTLFTCWYLLPADWSPGPGARVQTQTTFMLSSSNSSGLPVQTGPTLTVVLLCRVSVSGLGHGGLSRGHCVQRTRRRAGLLLHSSQTAGLLRTNHSQVAVSARGTRLPTCLHLSSEKRLHRWSQQLLGSWTETLSDRRPSAGGAVPAPQKCPADGRRSVLLQGGAGPETGQL